MDAVAGAVAPFWTRKKRRNKAKLAKKRKERLFPVVTGPDNPQDMGLYRSGVWRKYASFVDRQVLSPRAGIKGFNLKKRAKSTGIVAKLCQLTTHGVEIPKRIKYLVTRYRKVNSFKELKRQGSSLLKRLTVKIRQWSVPPLRPATYFLSSVKRDLKKAQTAREGLKLAKRLATMNAHGHW